MTEPRDKKAFKRYASDYVDVRDVAEAVIPSLKIEEAGGERFILDAGECLRVPCITLCNAW